MGLMFEEYYWKGDSAWKIYKNKVGGVNHPQTQQMVN